ncbi:MAG: hypothetical protein GQF41_0749 [Candidatus Rifleibacterium amylolyticum]|nr:MAG: hypothetical protein GQF41_0749 [Candidatus Rifleibacterium amylolyticum]
MFRFQSSVLVGLPRQTVFLSFRLILSAILASVKLIETSVRFVAGCELFCLLAVGMYFEIQP